MVRAKGGRVVRGLLLVVVAVAWCGWKPVELRAQLRGAGAGFFAAGVSLLDIDDLNTHLGAQGYPTFGREALSLGGGGYRLLAGGLMLGGEGYGLFAGEEAHEGRSVTLAGGYGLFKVGYVVAGSPRARLFPAVGIGGGALGLRIGSRASPDGFDAVLASPDRQALLSRGGFLLDVGAGAEMMPGRGARGPLVGVRVGYLFSPFPGSWRQDGLVAGGGPDATLAGPYVRATIGGGRRR